MLSYRLNFQGYLASAVSCCVKAGFALCLTHAVSKWKIQALVRTPEWLVIGIDCKPIDLQHFIWNLLYLLKQLIFASDHDAVFRVFCGNTNQWRTRQAVDVTSNMPMAIIKAYFAVHLKRKLGTFSSLNCKPIYFYIHMASVLCAVFKGLILLCYRCFCYSPWVNTSFVFFLTSILSLGKEGSLPLCSC